MSVLLKTMFVLIRIRSAIVMFTVMLTVIITVAVSSIGIVIETKHPVGNAVCVRLSRHVRCSSEQLRLQVKDGTRGQFISS